MEIIMQELDKLGRFFGIGQSTTPARAELPSSRSLKQLSLDLNPKALKSRDARVLSHHEINIVSVKFNTNLEKYQRLLTRKAEGESIPKCQLDGLKILLDHMMIILKNHMTISLKQILPHLQKLKIAKNDLSTFRRQMKFLAGDKTQTVYHRIFDHPLSASFFTAFPKKTAFFKGMLNILNKENAHKAEVEIYLNEIIESLRDKIRISSTSDQYLKSDQAAEDRACFNLMMTLKTNLVGASDILPVDLVQDMKADLVRPLFEEIDQLSNVEIIALFEEVKVFFDFGILEFAEVMTQTSTYMQLDLLNTMIDLKQLFEEKCNVSAVKQSEIKIMRAKFMQISDQFIIHSDDRNLLSKLMRNRANIDEFLEGGKGTEGPITALAPIARKVFDEAVLFVRTYHQLETKINANRFAKSSTIIIESHTYKSIERLDKIQKLLHKLYRVPDSLKPLFDIHKFMEIHPRIKLEKTLFNRLLSELRDVDLGDNEIISEYITAVEKLAAL